MLITPPACWRYWNQEKVVHVRGGLCFGGIIPADWKPPRAGKGNAAPKGRRDVPHAGNRQEARGPGSALARPVPRWPARLYPGGAGGALAGVRRSCSFWVRRVVLQDRPDLRMKHKRLAGLRVRAHYRSVIMAVKCTDRREGCTPREDPTGRPKNSIA